MQRQLPPVPRPFGLPRSAYARIYAYAPDSQEGLHEWLVVVARILAEQGRLVGDIRLWYSLVPLNLPVVWRTEYFWQQANESDSD